MTRALLAICSLAAGCGVTESTAPPDGAADFAQRPPGDAAAPADAATAADMAAAGLPAGWLYTKGAAIYRSDGAGGGARWMGRGVNLDDVFLCGYNNSLWMPSPDQTVETIVAGLIANWKPTFVRVSLGMASYQTVSWLGDGAAYRTPMTNVIQAIGAHPDVYVLVTVRSDASMIGQDQVDGDPEATGLPSAGTDAVYAALVDSFAHAPYVLFGIANEPGGNQLPSAQIAAAMDHAVGAIRAEEDKLGVPHHLVAVQGNGWTSDISFYAQAPLARDNVVYEVHGYPPMVGSYTYANLPVIIGEYGALDGNSAPAFYADLEAKQIPNLAWDFDPYSDCAPDLLAITGDASKLVPSAWGKIVDAYLLAHAQ